jgi:hypothetical protein
MKKYVLNVVILSFLAIGAGTYSASAQIYVSVHPVWAPVRRPPPPSPAHIWIDEDWVWRGGRYVAIGGRWEAPPRPGFVWFPGRWAHSGRGDRWIAGRWGRR